MSVHHLQQWSNIVKMRCSKCNSDVKRGRMPNQRPLLICRCCGYAWFEDFLKPLGFYSKSDICYHDAIDEMKLIYVE